MTDEEWDLLQPLLPTGRPGPGPQEWFERPSDGEARAMGRSRGRLTTRIHVAVDRKGGDEY